jgi:hypothetical protein
MQVKIDTTEGKECKFISLGCTQPVPGIFLRLWPPRKTDNLIAVCEQIVYFSNFMRTTGSKLVIRIPKNYLYFPHDKLHVSEEGVAILLEACHV